jgi:hypothetical protein
MEIRVLPNLGIAVDRISCPDTDIGVSGTICITCLILHEYVCMDLKCNGYVLVLIEVELIHLYVQNVLDQFELKLIHI